ncbi:helix-turn-helix domain-containing protein [Streptomyces sp. SYSU K21746]
MAIIVPMDPEAWAELGKRIREHREEAGYSRRALAEKAGVSEKSIQVAEEGRVPRGRMPQSLGRIEEALGWLPGAHIAILKGETWARSGPAQEVEVELESAASRHAQQVTAEQDAMPGLMSGRDVELTQSGHLAQDTFIRQMKRYRRLLNVSTEELAKRVSELGADVELKDLARLENGTRLLKMSEAEVIARALDTTAEWLLGSGFLSGVPEQMQAPPTDEELQVEAKAVERRIFEMGMQVNAARTQYAQARQREEEARQAAQYAQVIFEQTATQQAELERQYQYLLGRIDSLRAAKGEELILQTHPVTGRGGESIGQRLSRARREADMTVEDVHLLTRIRPRVVEAIERDDFTAAVGESNRDVYARGHIRVLARAFGLDPAPLLERYTVERGGRPDPNPRAPLHTADSGAKPRRRVVRIKKPKEDQ